MSSSFEIKVLASYRIAAYWKKLFRLHRNVQNIDNVSYYIIVYIFIRHIY